MSVLSQFKVGSRTGIDVWVFHNQLVGGIQLEQKAKCAKWELSLTDHQATALRDALNKALVIRSEEQQVREMAQTMRNEADG